MRMAQVHGAQVYGATPHKPAPMIVSPLYAKNAANKPRGVLLKYPPLPQNCGGAPFSCDGGAKREDGASFWLGIAGKREDSASFWRDNARKREDSAAFWLDNAGKREDGACHGATPMIPRPKSITQKMKR